MTAYLQVANISVDPQLHQLVEEEILPGLPITSSQIWEALATLLFEFQERNQKLLSKRDDFQNKIDEWHQENPEFEPEAYRVMLKDIGYLLPIPDNVEATTKNVDDEIANIAGPQLVVPVNNARYALNAANARWGSLYDALYGTDVLPGKAESAVYDQKRGDQVIQYAKEFLDKSVPLKTGSHSEVQKYCLENGELLANLKNGKQSALQNPAQFKGFRGTAGTLESILLCNNDLHIELMIDAKGLAGQYDAAGINDIQIEAALTTIMDCEDSVTAVDAEDKTLVYRNWLGLMKGDLHICMKKNGKDILRSMNPDREYLTPAGKSLTLHGRSILFVRNVGHLMTSDAVLNSAGEEVPEGILDGLFTTLCAMHDLAGNSTKKNSRTGSIYIVKPKMHGPEEVAFSRDLFERIEKLLGLTKNTIKMGIMDEERRTSLNLKACIAEAAERVVFINTGFLDRTGDEIHTSMLAGPMVPKGKMKEQIWINAYEDNNVEAGLATSLQGRAQIGKGMWAMPDLMADMLKNKIVHPMAGANTAWVPSPTAATLHALHYHQLLVKDRQNELKQSMQVDQQNLLEIPLLAELNLSTEEIKREIDNNCQGILGYVIRWVEGGVGCSKVPDIHQVALMEDRATLRISSQALANWLEQGICSKEQILESMQRMAAMVDQQNANEPGYRNMAPDFDSSIGFQAACELVFEGKSQPNGYTEPILHRRRREAKAAY